MVSIDERALLRYTFSVNEEKDKKLCPESGFLHVYILEAYSSLSIRTVVMKYLRLGLRAAL